MPLKSAVCRPQTSLSASLCHPESSRGTNTQRYVIPLSFTTSWADIDIITMALSLQDDELMTVESSPVPAGKRKRHSSTSTPHLMFVSILFIIAAILRSPAMESLATSSPTSYVPNRRLKHNHQSNKNETGIDYTIYSCDALRDLRTKYENTNRFNQCEFAHECNEGDGIIFPSLFCNYTTIQHSHIPLLLFLSCTLLLLFR